MIQFTQKFHNPRKNIVFFENITSFSLLLVLYYLFSEYPVYYLNAGAKIENLAFFKKNKVLGKIKKFDINEIDIKGRFADHNRALNTIEDYYLSHFGNDTQIQTVQKVVGSEFIAGCYKKVLLGEIFACYQNLSILRHLKKSHRGDVNIIFIPESSLSFKKTLTDFNGDELQEVVYTVPLFARLNLILSTYLKKIRSVLLIAGYPLWLLLKLLKKSDSCPNSGTYALGIRIYTNDVSFYYKYRSIDFLLDGISFHAKNTLFCIETPISKEYEDQLKGKGYNYVKFSELLNSVDREFIRKIIIGKFLIYWPGLVISSFFQSFYFNKITLDILNKYIHWKRFAELYDLGSYVVYNDFEADSIVRSIVLTENHVKTYYYIHSPHTSDVFTPPGYEEFRHILYPYLYFQFFITWGRKTQKYCSSYPTYIQNFYNPGCIWSQIVCEIEKSGSLIPVRNELMNGMIAGGKEWREFIVGVFDTSFGGEAPLSSSDMAAFLEGIVRFIEDTPDAIILFKPKKDLNDSFKAYPDIIDGYKRLKEHSRCCFVEDVFDVNEAIALSDFIISACFTSPTIEALGTRKKAIYYDASERFRGCYYDKFPHLVAHTYGELTENVQILRSMDKAEYDTYLSTFIKDELDAYLDGKGMTRLREHILTI